MRRFLNGGSEKGNPLQSTNKKATLGFLKRKIITPKVQSKKEIAPLSHGWGGGWYNKRGMGTYCVKKGSKGKVVQRSGFGGQGKGEGKGKKRKKKMASAIANRIGWALN